MVNRDLTSITNRLSQIEDTQTRKLATKVCEALTAILEASHVDDIEKS